VVQSINCPNGTNQNERWFLPLERFPLMPWFLTDATIVIPGWLVAIGYMVGFLLILALATFGALALWALYQLGGSK
jgi:hypothetical protein